MNLQLTDIADPRTTQALHLDQCTKDASFFIDRYVKIESRDSKQLAIPFKLWDKQKEVLQSFLTERLIQILKARQLGLTWLALSYSVWRIVFQSGYSIIALSKTEDDAKELIRRIRFILEHLPSWMISKKEWDYTALTVTIKKREYESTFKAFPASPEAGRSFTANILLLDEWAKQQWAKEIWQAAFPAINRPTGGQVIGLSTIQRGTLFEELWLNPESGFKKIFLSWTADPTRTQEWYDGTRKTMGDGALAEYPFTEAEAFAIPGGAFFKEFSSAIHIKKPLDTIPKWYVKYRTMDYGLDCLACYWIYIDEEGFARVYREVHLIGLVIGRAAYEILKVSGANVPSPEEWDALTKEQKQEVADTQTENIFLTYAPVDLFNRASNTGKSNAEVWNDNGIVLTKVKGDFEQGCISMSEWLHPIETKNVQTGEVYTTAKLTIDGGEDWNCAPNLVHSLLNIQKDKNNPKVYAKQPHILTHSCDSIRAMASEYNQESLEPQKPEIIRIKDYESAEVDVSNKAKM